MISKGKSQTQFKRGDWVKDRDGHQFIFEFDCLGKACVRSICGNYYLKDYSTLGDDDSETRKRIYKAEIRKGKRAAEKFLREHGFL